MVGGRIGEGAWMSHACHTATPLVLPGVPDTVVVRGPGGGRASTDDVGNPGALTSVGCGTHHHSPVEFISSSVRSSSGFSHVV